MKIVLFFTVCIIIMHVSVTAQVKIGNNPTTINSASLLELETTNQGFVLPRVSISDVSSSLPLAAGLLTGTVVYNISSTTTGGSGAGIYLWDGSKWLPLSTGISVSSSAWLLTGNSGLNAATNFIGTTDAIDFVARTANTERMRILGAASGSSKAGWIGMGITIPRSSLDIQGHYTNKNVLTIENSSTSGYSSVDMMDSAGNLKGTFGYANLGTGGIFAGKDYFNIYTNDFLFTTNLGNNDFYMKGSTGFIGLNTNAPSERLHVVGNFYLNGAFMPGGSAGTSGYVLTSAGAGLSPTWTATTNFAWSLTGNAGTTSSNFLGTTDAQNLRFKVNNQLSGLIDYSANSITTFGYQAGLNNGTTTGTTAFGWKALTANTTGQNNTAIGDNTMASNTTGSSNTALGFNTLAASITGGANTALGYGTLIANTASFNTGGGYLSLNNNISGAGNTAFGSNALSTNTTGSNNTAIGYNADVSAAGLTNATAIGYNAKAGASNTVILGSGDAKVGINTSTPAQKLEIAGIGGTIRAGGLASGGSFNNALTTTSSNFLYVNNATGDMYSLPTVNSAILVTGATGIPSWSTTALSSNAWLLTGNSATSYTTNFLGTKDNVSLRFRTNNAERMIIDSLGKIGIGLSNPAYALSVLSASNPLYLSGVQATATFTIDSILTINNGVVKKAANSSLTNNFWSLTGNSGTSYLTNFLGTTDNVSLRFRTNSLQRMIIDSLGRVGIGLSNPSYALSVLSALNPLYLSGVQATSTLTADSVLTINAGIVKKTSYNSLTGNFWSLNGNAGTNASNFLGTTDGVNLQFKVNNSLSGLIDFSNSITTFGYQAGLNNGSVTGTTAFGWSALTSNAKGDNNTAVGNNSMSANVSGASNTAIGYNTLANNDGGNNNTALGNESLLNNTASDNTAGGYLSLNSNIAGQGNTAFGVSTLITNTKGDYNTAIGYNADVLKDGFTNATAIGYNAKAGASNTVILGSDKVDVGIGTSTPARKLEVAGSSSTIRLGGVASGGFFNTASTATTSNLVYTDNSTGDIYALPTVNNSFLVTNASGVPSWSTTALSSNAWLLTGNSATSYATNFLGTKDNVSLRFRTNNVERMIIDSLGHVGIGSSTFNSTNPAKLLVDYGSTTSNTLANFRGSIDDYFQINLQNKSSGTGASSDFVATADDGTDSTNYIDMGINSSNYAPGVENWGGPHDGYLYVYGRHLIMGTQGTNSDVIFLLGGGKIKTNAALRLNGTDGNIIVGKGDGTNTPIGNVVRGPNAAGTNIAGGSLTLQGGSATGTATGGTLNISGGTAVSGTSGAVNINASINGATNINTGTSTGTVTLGNSLNNINLPKLSATSVVLTDASKNLTSTTPSNNTYLYYNGTNFTWATAASSLASLTNGAGIATLNYNGSSPATVALANGTASGQVYVTGSTPFTPSLVTMSGDATISSAGALSLATVNGNVGTFNNVTVNAKGLVTAASNVSYTTLGSFSATAPLTYNNATGVFAITQATTLANGYLSSADWNTFNNKVGSITLNTPSSVFSNPINFSVTSGAATGTLSLNTQTANTVFAGPAAGTAATPTFRALIAADIPSLAGLYIQNQSTLQASSNFNISGNGTIGTNLAVTGTSTLTGAVTSNAGITNSGILTSSGGITNINASSNFGTNVNTGTSTGNVTIGNSNNNLLLPKFNVAGGMIYTTAATGQIAGTGSNMTWDDVNNRLGIGTTSPGYKLSVLSASNPLYLSGVQITSSSTQFKSDSVLVIYNGVVKSAPYNYLPVAASAWLLTGNSGTIAGTNFLGTTDANDLVFKVNGTQAGYLGQAGGTSSSPYATSLGISSSITNYATAIGASSKAVYQSTAVGYNAQATGANSSLAVGYNSAASTQNSIAIGTSSVANGGNDAIAIGSSANANFTNGIAIGISSKASIGNDAIAIGNSANANYTGAIAIGTSAKASNGVTKNYAIAIGASAQSTSYLGIALGNNANASTNDYALAIGAGTTASGTQSTAVGYNASATASNSTAIGNGASTSQTNALVLGNGTTNVGIGTSTPNTTAKLDVDGSFKMGDIGTVNKNVVSFASTGSTVSLIAGTFDKSGVGGYTSGSTDITITIPSASNYLTSTQATVSVSPSADLPANVHIAFAKMISTSQVKIRLMNSSSAAQSFTGQFYITINEF